MTRLVLHVRQNRFEPMAGPSGKLCDSGISGRGAGRIGKSPETHSSAAAGDAEIHQARQQDSLDNDGPGARAPRHFGS